MPAQIGARGPLGWAATLALALACAGEQAAEQPICSAAELRALDPGPACVAGTRIELERSAGISLTPAEVPEPALASCHGLRNQVCIEQYAPVCAVFPDGTRRTHSNACNACENSTVKGWFDGPCPLR